MGQCGLFKAKLPPWFQKSTLVVIIQSSTVNLISESGRQKTASTCEDSSTEVDPRITKHSQ